MHVERGVEECVEGQHVEVEQILEGLVGVLGDKDQRLVYSSVDSGVSIGVGLWLGGLSRPAAFAAAVSWFTPS
jgi:hypothetical protein